MARSISITELNPGDLVFHRTNKNIYLLILEKDILHSTLKCRWLDVEGRTCVETFNIFELILPLR